MNSLTDMLNLLTNHGAGLIALVGIGYACYRLFNVYLRKQENNASGEQTLLAQLHEQIKVLGVLNREWAGRYDEMVQKSMTLAQTHGQQMLEAIERVRSEHETAVTNLQRQLDEAKRLLDDCQDQHDDCRRDVAQLREFVMEAMGDKKPQ